MTKLGNLTRCHDIKPVKEALGNNVNIYITNDEEIKEGEYQLYNPLGNFDNSKVSKAERLLQNDGRRKKIILTTDQDLIKDGVQTIDDEFLEWFVKNPSCEEVETKLVEFEVDMGLGESCIEYGNYYKIIIPEEEVCSLCEKNVLIDGICKECTELICKPFSVVEKQEPKLLVMNALDKDCVSKLRLYNEVH